MLVAVAGLALGATKAVVKVTVPAKPAVKAVVVAPAKVKTAAKVVVKEPVYRNNRWKKRSK